MSGNNQLQLPSPNNTSPTQAPMPMGRGKKPIPTMLLGLLMMMLWLILEMVDIEASEAIYTHIAVKSFTPEWQLVLQIPRILTGAGGAMSVAEAQGSIVAWVLAACSLTCVIGWDLAHDAMRHANPRLIGLFGSGLVIGAIVDLVANFMFGPGGGTWWGQALFAIVVTFAGLFFGVPGFRMLEHGVKTWKTGY